MASYNGGGLRFLDLTLFPPLTSQILVFVQPTVMQNTEYDN